jgi:hypothetical protein
MMNWIIMEEEKFGNGQIANTGQLRKQMVVDVKAVAVVVKLTVLVGLIH